MSVIATPREARGSGKFWRLLASLVLLFAILPLAAALGSAAAYGVAVLYLLVLVTSVTTVARSTRDKWLTYGAAFLAIAGHLVSFAAPGFVTDLFESVAYLLFFSLVCWQVLRHVLTAGAVDADRLYAVCAVYLLAAMAWAFAYSTVELVSPGSFSLGPTAQSGGVAGPLIYFSMVTLTTLGYGDISPISGFARALASLEAALGQIYLAVLVARLLGFQMATGESSVADSAGDSQ